MFLGTFAGLLLLFVWVQPVPRVLAVAAVAGFLFYVAQLRLDGDHPQWLGLLLLFVPGSLVAKEVEYGMAMYLLTYLAVMSGLHWLTCALKRDGGSNDI